MIPQLDTSTYISQLFWMVISLAVLVSCFKLCIIPRIVRLRSARRMHIESLKARINEIDTKISSVRSEADLLHKDSLRKAAEIMAGAQAEANSTLANKIKSLIEESDKKIVDIKERFNHEFDDDLTGRADRVAEKVLDSLFGSADGEK